MPDYLLPVWNIIADTLLKPIRPSFGRLATPISVAPSRQSETGKVPEYTASFVKTLYRRALLIK
jgi:hypothetical protein